ncbi:DUF998 domain-containing protein [Nocardioides sp. 503]|uniref:DUF998 domain-containing protein n=1 Tax=Nocardioides sp. 503 TaxID=2508326 RepID=UPI0010700D0B|nr:DUF998 domain-containing protein [Nocardioides sp. 503]
MAQALRRPLRRPVGAGLLLLQPVVIAMQLLVASRWPGFDHVRDTVSDLGSQASPAHVLMNVAFVVVGGALAAGAVLAAPELGRTPAGLLLVSGVGSLAVGLAPVDTAPGWHSAVALPVFVAQPLALLLLGAPRRGSMLGRELLVAGLVAAAGSTAFAITLALDAPGGLVERFALWSCHLGVAVVGYAVLRGLLLEDR